MDALDKLKAVEKAKQEADSLMINKIIKYESQIAQLKKELEETRSDNKKLAEQVNDYVNQLRKGGIL